MYDLIKNTSDKEIIDIYYYVLQKAFAPFIQMLSQWIYHGHVDDMFGEFFISEDIMVKRDNISKEFKDNYWDKRFSLKNINIPKLLEPWKELIF